MARTARRGFRPPGGSEWIVQAISSWRIPATTPFAKLFRWEQIGSFLRLRAYQEPPVHQEASAALLDSTPPKALPWILRGTSLWPTAETIQCALARHFQSIRKCLLPTQTAC